MRQGWVNSLVESQQLDVVVVGSANTDYTVRGKRLPKPSETAQGDQFLIAQGGKGANQAVAAARLGARVALIARVGNDDRGDAVFKQLRNEDVDTEYVIRDNEMPTGAAVIQVEESGEKQIFMAPNANSKLTVQDVQKSTFLRNARIIVTQLEIPFETVLEVVKIGHETGAKIVLDPAPSIKLSDDFLQRITLIKPNSKEAEGLTGIKVTDQNSARNAANRLIGSGVHAVAIQAGDEGNLLKWQEGEVWLPKVPVNSVDATGAGDAFVAAVAVALAEGQPWEDIGYFANAAAALTTTKLGAQDALPSREEVRQLMLRNENKFVPK
jgi:ribokinase